MAFSDEARKSAALARKIKHRLGQAAYEEFRKTGRVPAGLGGTPTKSARSAANKLPSSPEAVAAGKAADRADEILRAASQRRAQLAVTKPAKAIDPKIAKIASSIPNLSDRNFMAAMRKQQAKSPRKRFEQIAHAQALAALPDNKFIGHYKDTAIFARRGEKPETVRQIRDTLHSGGRVPLWAVPAGTQVGIYRDSEIQNPDMIATVLGHFERVPEGLSKPVPYVRFKDQDGNVYEYPSLLGGGPKSPQAQFASYTAIDSILRDEPQVDGLGFGFPNFYSGIDAGPTGYPEDLTTLMKGMQRASSWASAVAARKAAQQEGN